jgi:hypothetical protein
MTSGDFGPLPIDGTTAMRIIVDACECVGIGMDRDAVRSILRGDCRLETANPAGHAIALAQAWTMLVGERTADPRAGVRIVIGDGAAAAQMRRLSLDAVTPFTHGHDPHGLDGIGLLVVVGARAMDREQLVPIMAAPHHVRIVLLEFGAHPDSPSFSA